MRAGSMKRRMQVAAVVDEEGSMMKSFPAKRKAEEGQSAGEEDLSKGVIERKAKAPSATGEEGSLKGLTTERKAEEEAAAAAACVAQVSEGGKVADAVRAVAAGGGLARAENGMWILPDEEVQFILSWEEQEIPPSMRESFLKRQAYVRSQYEANNRVVLIDDEMAAERAERRKEQKEDLKDLLLSLDLTDGIPLSQWKFSDRDSDFFDSDSEEEEEVVQAPIKAN